MSEALKRLSGVLTGAIAMGWLSDEEAAELRRLAPMEAELQQAREERTALLVNEQNLREELERERIRLAACGVVAMSNTRESAAKHREMAPEYWSASCGDVVRAVDAEMALREELAALRASLGEPVAEVVTVAGISQFTEMRELFQIGRPPLKPKQKLYAIKDTK